MKRRRTLITMIAILLAFAPGSLRAAEFTVGGPEATDSVFFRSTAKLEFIEGKTGDLNGAISFDPSDLTKPISGVLKVDLRTLKTGIDLRDQHMRERHLDTDEFPYAFFEVDSVSGLPAKPDPDMNYAANVFGFFYIRGVKRQHSATAMVSFGGQPEAETVTVSARFQIQLEDYRIPRPTALFMKLAETIEVELRFVGVRSKAPHPPQLPDWSQVD